MGKRITGLSADVLKTILDNLYDEVVVVDASDRIIYANKASERHYSVRKKSLVGKKVYEIPAWFNWEPNTLPMVKRTKKRLTIEQTSPIGENILTTATPVPVSFSQIQPFRGSQGVTFTAVASGTPSRPKCTEFSPVLRARPRAQR